MTQIVSKEETFKKIVNDLIDEGVYPTPTIINTKFEREVRLNHLNGREVRWRREVMKKRGIKLMRPYNSHRTRMRLLDKAGLIAKQVCPNCGELVEKLIDRTGWCTECSHE